MFQYGPDYAVLLAFLSGLIILSCGMLRFILLYLSQPPPTHDPHRIDHSNLFITRLGFLIDFISVPVIAGFTSAAAITIASSQVLVVMVKVVSINGAKKGK